MLQILIYTKIKEKFLKKINLALTSKQNLRWMNKISKIERMMKKINIYWIHH